MSDRGIGRRSFLLSAAQACAALVGAQRLTACSSKEPTGRGVTAGSDAAIPPSHDAATGEETVGYCVPPESTASDTCERGFELDGGGDFVFDVYTRWADKADLDKFPAYAQTYGAFLDVATEDEYVRQLFCLRTTSVACLSPMPGLECSPTRSTGCGVPLTNDHIADSRDRINALAGHTQRVLNHVLVMPQDPSGVAAQRAVMRRFRCEKGVAAWALYPGFKPGFRLDEPGGVGQQIVEYGLELGLPLFCVHKGVPILNFFDTDANYPDDIGPVAAKYPDAKFIVYDAAYCTGANSCSASIEGPYDASVARPAGVDALVRSLEASGIGPGGNVYAVAGMSAGAQMAPDAAAHVFGKLLRHLGEDNVLWGTGALTSGNPASQLAAFRSLTIPESMRAAYGYPELSADIKAKILGLNAARLYGVDPAAVRCLPNVCPTV